VDDLPWGIDMHDERPLILVVEDEDGIRNLISTILRLSGYDVLGAQDGEEAQGLLKDHGGRIRMAITDVNLGPSMGGVELAHNLRTLLPSVKILYISGREDEDGMIREVNDGKAGFLSKPFTPKSLTDKVGAALSEAALLVPAGVRHS
jgi:two-component system, cell cycle sensor histidine kinase and response regulator CckA